MGLFALTLRLLDWRVAAAIALAALLFNLFVMPRIGRGIYRDGGRKLDAGIVAYPAMVLVVIILFRYQLEAAAALWAMMAFGDPAATIAGKVFGGPRLPWNEKKRWSGFLAYVVVGGFMAGAFWMWVSLRRAPEPVYSSDLLVTLLLPVVLVGAFLESLETGIDDNWVPPIPCSLLFAYVFTMMLEPHLWGELQPPMWLTALFVNAVVAILMGTFGVVKVSGAIAGAVVGTIILAFCGWPAYAVLWGFFLLGTLATRLGFLRKTRRGTAQASAGRRGARHVFANCGVGVSFCVLSYFALKGAEDIFGLAFVSAFAAALADTLGTEIGSLYGRRTFSLVTGKIVAAGTPGGVSLPGFLAGLVGAALMGVLGCFLGLVTWKLLWVVAAAGFLGSVAESVVRDIARWRGTSLDHEFANAFNTFVGAVVGFAFGFWIWRGYLGIPFDWRVF
jgi:uncharacterized protein (TIGR00297 family)